MKITFRTKTFDGHKGIPGHRGGSLPKEGGGDASQSSASAGSGVHKLLGYLIGKKDNQINAYHQQDYNFSNDDAFVAQKAGYVRISEKTLRLTDKGKAYAEANGIKVSTTTGFTLKDRHPNILAALREMALDNDGRVNLKAEIPENRINDFYTADYVLGQLSKDELVNVTSGEESDMKKILGRFGKQGRITDKLLNDIFDDDIKGFIKY